MSVIGEFPISFLFGGNDMTPFNHFVGVVYLLLQLLGITSNICISHFWFGFIAPSVIPSTPTDWRILRVAMARNISSSFISDVICNSGDSPKLLRKYCCKRELRPPVRMLGCISYFASSCFPAHSCVSIVGYLMIPGLQ